MRILQRLALKQSDGAPVTCIQLEDKRNNPMSLGQGQGTGGISCIKNIDQGPTKHFLKANIECHRQTI